MNSGDKSQASPGDTTALWRILPLLLPHYFFARGMSDGEPTEPRHGVGDPAAAADEGNAAAADEDRRVMALASELRISSSITPRELVSLRTTTPLESNDEQDDGDEEEEEKEEGRDQEEPSNRGGGAGFFLDRLFLCDTSVHFEPA